MLLRGHAVTGHPWPDTSVPKGAGRSKATSKADLKQVADCACLCDATLSKSSPLSLFNLLFKFVFQLRIKL